MDDHADFDSVSWPRETQNEASQPPTPITETTEATLPTRPANGRRSLSGPGEPQAGEQADGVDLAGIGDGTLDCTVDTPLKENDGTKDAYVSYLITTNVGRLRRFRLFHPTADHPLDGLQILPEK